MKMHIAEQHLVRLVATDEGRVDSLPLDLLNLSRKFNIFTSCGEDDAPGAAKERVVAMNAARRDWCLGMVLLQQSYLSCVTRS